MASVPLPVCPKCGGPKSRNAKTCWSCMDKRTSAAFCPVCGGPKDTKSKTCRNCMPHHGPQPRTLDQVLRDPETARRFMTHVGKSVDPDGCWLWTGSISNGYGSVGLAGRTWHTSIASYLLFVGPIPDGLMVCHTCDVRACVAPHHLFLGTGQDNLMDAASKGRINTQKLTEADVRLIQSLYAAGDISQAELAQRFGISQSHVWRIVKGHVWRFLD